MHFIRNPKPASPKEAVIQADILRYLALAGVYARRLNIGMIPNGKGGFRSSLMVGMSDIVGVLPGGRFIAIEVKRKGGKPTEAQQEFLDAVTRAGGLAFVATSAQEVKDMIERERA